MTKRRIPYDWSALSAFFRARVMPGIDHVDETRVARRVITATGPVTIIAARRATGLSLKAAGAAPDRDQGDWAPTAARVFDTGADPAAIAEVLGRDPVLAPLVAERPGLRIPGAWSPFEAAVRAIIGQQVSVKAAVTLTARVVAQAGPHGPPCPETGLTRTFPGPEDILAADLDGLGLTQRRIDSLKALATAAQDEAFFAGPGARDRLIALPGIGPWTADYVALRGLGDRDAFLPGDLVIRKALGGGTPIPEKAAAAHAEGWRPYRAYAAMHLWASMSTAAA